MKFPKWALAIALCLYLTACGLLDPVQQSAALQTLDGMLKNGSITQAQYEALREIVLNGSQTVWWQQLGTAVAGAGLAWLGVRSKLPLIGRGAPTQIVGLPASKVTQ